MQRIPFRHVRSDIAQVDRAVCQGGEGIQGAHGGGGFLDGRRLFNHAPANVLEEGLLQRHGTFVGSQNLVLILLQLRRDEPLGVDQGLFANVGLWHVLQLPLGHFDIVAEDLVVTDLQVSDTAAFLFGGLVFGQPFSPLFGRHAQVIQLLVVTAPYHATVLQADRRFIGDGLVDQVNHVWQVLQTAGEFGQQPDRGLVKQGTQGGYFNQRLHGRDQVAGVSGTGAHARNEPLQVAHAARPVAQLTQGGPLPAQVLDGIVTSTDFGDVRQGTRDPFTEGTPSHGGPCHIEDAEQRMLRLRAGRRHQIQVPAGGLIELHVALGLPDTEAAHVPDLATQVLAYIVQHGTGRARDRPVTLTPEPA